MLRKLTATGILAAAVTGAMLSAGPANADRTSTAKIDPCVTVPGFYQPPAWCNTYSTTPYYPPIVTAPAPIGYYPGYGGGYGWNRWHHNPYHWHR
ncbi:hypothetical protein [Actinomadura sp. DC4]|uniref:hypothetical protein n=1 Tax=Actinomadura sp. DC4 TaxID=3055069 RepID=UPI0025AF8AF7|nr:hypothetical protein [Actinomadura sp. DC4]MDN3360092.1 hypothetical protein [Actinomadura sp. DC4]